MNFDTHTVLSLVSACRGNVLRGRRGVEIDIRLSNATDGFELRAYQLRHRGKIAKLDIYTSQIEAAYRRQLLTDCPDGMLAFITDQMKLLLTMLESPRVPFRIGTRSPRRLQIAKAA